MKVLKGIIGVLIAVLVIGGFGYYIYKENAFVSNGPTAVGNTPGNLNNGGLFCEYNGKIYFANPYDDDRLYVMNSDCSDAKKLNEDTVAYLNVSNDSIYYVKNNFSEDTIGAVFRGQLFGLYRCNLDGSECKSLYSKLSGKMSLAGDYIYYQHYDEHTPLSLHKVRIDGKKNKQISATPYIPSCVTNQKIYFVDETKNNAISVLDTKSDQITKFYDANAYMIDYQNNYLYYIDLNQNYSIVRLNMGTQTVELLYTDNTGKIVSLNVYGNKIFFQLESETDGRTGLYRMNTDGTQVEFIASGDLTKVSCTSKYTFFRYYEEPETLYRVPTTSPITKVEEIVIK